MMNSDNFKNTSNQKGISLVMVMISLVILSTLAISAMQGAGLFSRMAANESDRAVAFRAAEAALRDAEHDITGRMFDGTICPVASPVCRAELIDMGNGFDASCSNGRCDKSVATPWEISTIWSNATPSNNAAVVNGSVVYGFYTGAPPLPLVAQPPRYIVRYFNKPYTSVYEITVIGFGANAATRVFLQSNIKVENKNGS